MNDDATNPENTAQPDDEAPAVFAVKKGVKGWQLNRRDFLATAAASAVAGSAAGAGSTAAHAAGAVAPEYVRIQVLTAVQSPSIADAGAAAAVVATTTPTATPPPGKTPHPARKTPTATPKPTPRPAPLASYVADVTIPDNTVFAPDTPFTKTWRLKNSGSQHWGETPELAFVSGDAMNAPAAVSVEEPPFGDTVDISVDMVAPSEPGVYKGEWRMRTADGESFRR